MAMVSVWFSKTFLSHDNDFYIILEMTDLKTQSKVSLLIFVIFFPELSVLVSNRSMLFSWPYQIIYTFFFIRKPFFCASLDFLNIMPEIRLRFS